MKEKRVRHIGLNLLRVVLVAAVLAFMTSSSTDVAAQRGGTLSYGARVYGTISATAPLVSYTFTGQQDDFVAISGVSWAGTLDIALELVAPDGAVLARAAQNMARDELHDAYLSVVLPQSGQYVLRLSGEAGSIGEFLLSVLGRPAATPTVLEYGEAIVVNVPAAAPIQYFSFEAEDCPTTMVADSISAGLPFSFPFVVRVRDQRGLMVAQLRGGQQIEDWVTVEADSGRYEIEVSAAEPALAGSLRLLVVCSGANPHCSAVSPDAGVAPCPPCPSLDEWVENGCPEMGLVAEQVAEDPVTIAVEWTPIPGVQEYAVYVTGNIAGGGEAYLTHSEWIPGDPPRFEWVLPAMGYSGYTFALQALVDDVVLCTDETSISLPGEQGTCPDLGLALSAVEPPGTTRVGWFAFESIDGYRLTIFGTDDVGTEHVLFASDVMPPGVTYRDFSLPDVYQSLRFLLELVGAPIPCTDEIVVARAQEPGTPCAVVTDRSDVAVRVGPGTSRGHFMNLPPGIEYLVIGQAADETGMEWWQLDKTQFAGHEAVISLWVAKADVEELGVCTNIPQVEIPPIIPDPEEPPEQGWGPCGSCDTCGHPASECVTSPEGLCLWDPATCTSQEPEPPGDGTVCYRVRASIDMGQCFGSGSVTIDTAPNCQGDRYTPGTLVQAHASVEDQKCVVKSWSGCGASGAGPTVSFMPPHNCTIVAHMGY